MAPRYWVNDAADGNWHNASNWSATDGGAGGAGVPTASDDIYFTASESSNCTAANNASCRGLSMQGYTGALASSGAIKYINCSLGNVAIDGLGAIVGDGNLYLSYCTISQWDIVPACRVRLSTSTATSIPLHFTSLMIYAQIVDTIRLGPAITVDSTLTLTPRDAGETLTINCATNNTTWILKGDVAQDGSGVVAWTKGTGTITFSGSADQTVNFLGLTVEDIVINKSAGKVTFTNAWTSDSFTITAGTVAFGATGYTLTTTGDWTITSSGQIDPTNLDGWTWAVGGALSLSGASGDLLDLGASGAWTLTVAGAASATYTTVAYSDATAGSDIDADDGTNVDEGDNTGWVFPVVATTNRRRRLLCGAW